MSSNGSSPQRLCRYFVIRPRFRLLVSQSSMIGTPKAIQQSLSTAVSLCGGFRGTDSFHSTTCQELENASEAFIWRFFIFSSNKHLQSSQLCVQHNDTRIRTMLDIQNHTLHMNPSYYHSMHGYYSKWDVQDPEWVDIGSREDKLSRSRLARKTFLYPPG